MVTGADRTGFYVTDGEAHYKSAIHLAEINLRRQWCDGLTLLVGFRTGELDELYTAYGLGARTPVGINVNTNTYNHLYGFQTGADYEFYNMGGPLKISALCKAGIYGNSAMQSSRQIEGATTDQTLDAHRRQTAFIGEAGTVATYQVTCHLCAAGFVPGRVDRGRCLGARADSMRPISTAGPPRSTPTAASSITAADLARN